MLVNTSNRRHNLNLNLDTDLNKWLKMGVTFRGDLSKRGQTENFNVAAEARPIYPVTTKMEVIMFINICIREKNGLNLIQ